MFSYTLVAFSIALLTSSANAAADCTQKPSAIASNCCILPTPNLGAFEAQCSEFKPRDLCYFECMLNAFNVLDGENFNMENARQMVSSLLNGDQELTDAIMLGFKECESEAKQKISAYKAKTLKYSPKIADCELRGHFYGICVAEMIYANCPKSAWTASKKCEAAKEIATTCKPLSFIK